MADDRFELLKSVSLFEGLSDGELRTIGKSAKEVEFEPGREIVTAGETGVGFHLIVDGEAFVDVGGERKTLTRGAYFGEIALLDGGRRSATVTARTAVRTLSLISWQFLAMVENNPSIMRKILVQLSKRVRQLEQEALTH